MCIQLNTEGVGKFPQIGRGYQPDGQHHHIEFFLFYSIVGSRIPYGYILRYRVLPLYRYIASDKPNPGKGLRSLVESLKILSVGTDIVMKYRTLCAFVMILRQDDLLLCIGAAYRRTVAMASLNYRGSRRPLARQSPTRKRVPGLPFPWQKPLV